MGAFASKAFFSQSFNIPLPTLTEKTLPDQSGRVVLITGGYAGVGQELSRILYQNNATVYVAGRSAEKAEISITATQKLFPESKGRIEFLQVDLADLSTIKQSAQRFLDLESRLDVLVNNAGVMFPPAGQKDVQGHELQMGTMVLGHFLFTQFLTPLLASTAASSQPNSVRVLWAGSLGINIFSPPNGVAFDSDSNAKVFTDQQTNYGQAKAANMLLASEFGKFHSQEGIVSVCFNPGNLMTELQRHSTGFARSMVKFILYPAIFGGYTELWAGWSEEITVAKSGMYVGPWGQDMTDLLRKDVAKALKSRSEGGSGVAEELWTWCEKETKAYA